VEEGSVAARASKIGAGWVMDKSGGKEMGAGAKIYCGNCLMLVTRSPVKRTKMVLEGGWP
jgi:hypothetical protein